MHDIGKQSHMVMGQAQAISASRRHMLSGDEVHGWLRPLNSLVPRGTSQRKRYGIQHLTVQLTLTPNLREDRKPVDPPPIVQLRIRDSEEPGW